MSHRIVLLGPPGAGKSTVTPPLMEGDDLVLIATGLLLRAEIASNSALGQEVAPFINGGDLVPDSLMDRLLRVWIERLPPEQGFLLDGYPRTLEQAHALDALLSDLGRPLTAVIGLEMSDDEVVRRLEGRRICLGSGEPWTLHMSDAAAVARCAAQGGRLTQRPDDQPDVLRQRLTVYHEQTQPLLAYYRAARLLYPLDAHGGVEEVQSRAVQLLQRLG